MDKSEATAVLDQQLASFVRRSYAELVAIVDQPQSAQANGPSGAAYQIEFNVFYDSGRSGRPTHHRLYRRWRITRTYAGDKV